MKTELQKSPQGDSFMTPENHTLFDWKTLDEFSDLNRLEMVFTSLPAPIIQLPLVQTDTAGDNSHTG